MKFDNAPFNIIDGECGNNYPKQHEFMNKGHCLFLNAKNVTNECFNFMECQFISKEKDYVLRKGKLQPDDSTTAAERLSKRILRGTPPLISKIRRKP